MSKPGVSPKRASSGNAATKAPVLKPAAFKRRRQRLDARRQAIAAVFAVAVLKRVEAGEDAGVRRERDDRLRVRERKADARRRRARRCWASAPVRRRSRARRREACRSLSAGRCDRRPERGRAAFFRTPRRRSPTKTALATAPSKNLKRKPCLTAKIVAQSSCIELSCAHILLSPNTVRFRNFVGIGQRSVCKS